MEQVSFKDGAHGLRGSDGRVKLDRSLGEASPASVALTKIVVVTAYRTISATSVILSNKMNGALRHSKPELDEFALEVVPAIDRELESLVTVGCLHHANALRVTHWRWFTSAPTKSQ